MHIETVRPNVLAVTLTTTELSTLVAGARMALDAMRGAPEAPAEAIEILEHVLGDFDRARDRVLGREPELEPDGPPPRATGPDPHA